MPPSPSFQTIMFFLDDYIKRGWQVLPIHYTKDGLCTCGEVNCQNAGKHPRTGNGLYDATTDRERISEWVSRWDISLNFAIRTGAVSNLVVLDIDNKTNENGVTGFDSLNDLIQKNGDLPDTLQVESGSGGRHYYFLHPGMEIRNIQDKRKIGYGIDIRGDGGYIVCPPSMHRVGKRYKWINPGTQPGKMPDWLLNLIMNKDLKTISAGERNNTIFQTGAALKAHGIPSDDIATTLQAVNKGFCYTPLDQKEIQNIQKSLEKYPEGITCDDIGNGIRLCNAYGNVIRYCNKWGRWYIWDSMRWKEDDTRLIEYMAKKVSKSIYSEAALTQDTKVARSISTWAHESSCTSRVSAMIRMASSEHERGIPITHEMLDTDKLLINLKNGTFDLRTCELLPHDQINMITKLANVEYIPTATCPLWLKFLDRIFRGQSQKKEILSFLKKSLGYSLSGLTKESVIFFLHGGGSNGKSTFIDTIQHILGDYAATTEAATFTTARSDGIRNDIARLVGKRFVCASENSSDSLLDEELIKKLTGGSDKISARFLHQEHFEFYPEFKIWWYFNHTPALRDQTYSIERRLRLIPFEETIPISEQDRDLTEKLKNEASGIFNWMVEGWKEYQKNGLASPEIVTKDTKSYMEDQDILIDFIQDICNMSGNVRASEIYNAYKNWAEYERVPVRDQISSTKLGRLLSQRDGVKRDRDHKGKYYTGISLKSSRNII